MLHTTSRGNRGKWKLLAQDRGNEAVPRGSCAGRAWFPTGSETVLYVPHLNNYHIHSSPLPLCPHKILRLPQLLLNLSPHHSSSSLPSVYPSLLAAKGSVCYVQVAAMHMNACTPSKQAGLSSLGLSLHKTLLCPADGSHLPCRHSWWDPPHLTPPAL